MNECGNDKRTSCGAGSGFVLVIVLYVLLVVILSSFTSNCY